MMCYVLTCWFVCHATTSCGNLQEPFTSVEGEKSYDTNEETKSLERLRRNVMGFYVKNS